MARAPVLISVVKVWIEEWSIEEALQPMVIIAASCACCDGPETDGDQAEATRTPPVIINLAGLSIAADTKPYRRNK